MTQDNSLSNAIESYGLLTFNSAPDYETPGSAASSNTYSLTVTASDGVNSSTKDLIVNISDVDEIPPTITGASSFSTIEGSLM